MRMIDLSLPINNGMSVYPGDPQVSIKKVHSYQTHDWELRELTFGTHTGTHVDAYSHMHQGELSIDQIPLHRFCGEAQLVSVEGKWPVGVGLLFQEPIDCGLLDEIIHVQPNFVGGNISESLERALLGHHIITYTNLNQLDLLPQHETFMFYGFPLPIKNGDGSPVRAVAILK